MARPPRPDQFAALTHIRECVAAHGEEIGSSIARARFPKVDKGTWSRWKSQVINENRVMEAQPTSAALAPGSATQLQSAEAVVVPDGVIDFYSQVGAMMAACDGLQDYAWPRDPATGVRKVRNPAMLERATRLRVMVLDLAVRREESARNIERSRNHESELHEAILGAITGDDSAAAKKIIEALRALDARSKTRDRYLGSP